MGKHKKILIPKYKNEDWVNIALLIKNSTKTDSALNLDLYLFLSGE